MLVHKYYCRPHDTESEAAALDEIARYVQARNRLLKLAQKWQRVHEDMILPEYRARAAEHRATPRTGRKPTKVRSDHDELRAADQRAEYAAFVAAGGSYATWWLAEAAAKKAKHPVRDEYAGRAGMLPQWLSWDGSLLRYCGTTWSVHARMLAQRPIPDEADVVQAWLQRERTSTSLLRQPRYRWFLVLVMDDVSPRMHTVDPDRAAAGLDIAWRRDASTDTLRVAYVADDRGQHRSVKMRPRQYARLQHAASLQRLADEDANVLRAELRVPANTSHRRLLELAPAHPSGEHMVHLLEWHHGARRNAIASRDAHYLAEAHALCRAHHTVYVERIKGTPKLVQRPSTRRKAGAGDDAEGGIARDQRQMVAAFTFLRVLQREAPKFGTAIVEVPPAYTSRVCHACAVDMGPPGALRERTCSACGQRWDVDHLAALNLLHWGRTTASSEAPRDPPEALASE